jgi:Tol biopolymer transport system component
VLRSRVIHGALAALVPLIVAVSHSPARADAPAAGWVVWSSDREDGRHEVYIKEANSGEAGRVRRLSFEGGMYPAWSPDGRWIAYYSVHDFATHVVRRDGSGEKVACKGVIRFWMHDNSGLVCGHEDTYYLADPETGDSQQIFAKGDFAQVADKDLRPYGITNDGRWLVAATDRYRTTYTGDNGSFMAPWWAAVALDLQDKSKLYYIGYGCEPTTPPEGPLVYHVCGDCPTEPDIYKMDLNDLFSRGSYSPEIALPDENWGHEYFPRVSNDNRWLVYGASTGCQDHLLCDYEIFTHRLGAGNTSRTRITFNEANDQWPSLHVDLPEPEQGCSIAAPSPPARSPIWSGLVLLICLGLLRR